MSPFRSAWLLTLLAGAKAGDPCECLNWDKLYQPAPGKSQPRILCGEGREAFFMPLIADYAQAYFLPMILGFSYHEFCASFYHRMTNNYCPNTNMAHYGAGGDLGGSWCYVSNECKDLNGGQRIADKQSFYHGPDFLAQFSPFRTFFNYITPKSPIPRDLSYKLCTAGKDTRLRDFEPEDLLALAHSMDSVVGAVTKLSYPRLLPPGDGGVPGYTWDQVKAAVQAGDTSKMPKQLADAIKANETIIIDVDPEGHTGQKLIKGSRIIELENSCDESGCGAKQWPYKRGRDVGEL